VVVKPAGISIDTAIARLLRDDLAFATTAKQSGTMMEPEEVIKRFAIPDTTSSLLQESPYIEGSPTFRYEAKKEPFQDRRIILVNFSASGLYRYAYDVTYPRCKFIINEHQLESARSAYRCIDIVVPEADSSRRQVRDTLLRYLSRDRSVTVQKKEVVVDSCYILTRLEKSVFQPSVKRSVVAI
jgi:hypothetical protein